METTTPFDLNRAIEQWRGNLAQSPAVSGENLRELESHLRDSLATLQTSGLSAQEAFLIATRRMGQGGALEREFAKVNRRAVWLDRALWMLMGLQIWRGTMVLTGALVLRGLTMGWTQIHHDDKGGSLVLPLVLCSVARLLALGASVVLCWWLVIRKGEKLGAWLTPLLKRRSVLVAIGVGTCVYSFINVQVAVGMVRNIWTVYNLSQKSFATAVSPFGEFNNLFNLSQVVIGPIQELTMLMLTLVLARKRLCLKKEFAA